VPVVLYGCETWSVTLREERRLGVLESRLLMKIVKPACNGTAEKRMVSVACRFCLIQVL
jgi:hypothetical protein